VQDFGWRAFLVGYSAVQITPVRLTFVQVKGGCDQIRKHVTGSLDIQYPKKAEKKHPAPLILGSLSPWIFQPLIFQVFILTKKLSPHRKMWLYK
jgi:hypothetical protein